MALTKVGSGVIQDDAVGIANLGATGTADATTFLRGDNAWTAIASAGFSRFHVIEATGTYTVPASITKIVVEVQAGGGGGGGAAGGSTNTGAGGSGGAYAKKQLTVVADNTMTVTIGAAGAGNPYSGGGAGTAGGTSSFAALAGGASFTTITCAGGGAGGGQGGVGGVGGTVTSASATYDLRVDGQNGTQQTPKDGGSSAMGRGGRLQAAGNGDPATGYGAGGSGGSGEATGGGTGTVGVVTITEYK